ncbi:MAG: class I SAM-dependent methyltransferase [Anaerolineales bacterium]
MSEAGVKQEVRQFYDSIGWRQIGDGLYQNARFEDLRPVSQEYLHRCHLRVGRFLPTAGEYLLDAGSGPIQYPEYLTYSEGFRYRVCLDISALALAEARRRIGDHGLFVVADVAHLPFDEDVFGGLVSLHTVHHLPAGEHKAAFDDFYRTLRPGGQAVVVYSWGSHSPLMRWSRPFIQAAFALIKLYRRARGKQDVVLVPAENATPDARELVKASGTFTYKHTYDWVNRTLSSLPGFEVRVWRSISTSFMRALIHQPLLGKLWLKLIFWLEERFPHWLGRVGQYPMILFEKPSAKADAGRRQN